MIIFLFSVLLICFGIYYSIMNQKLSTQKTQLKIISRQNREFKSKIESARSAEGPIIIKYKAPLFKSGTTKEVCSLYLSPLENSLVLSNLVKITPVEIQDCAEIFDISWYEVSIKSQTNINNKGWIKKDSIITQDDTVNNQEDTVT
ncbi:hypothetical protein [Clostridium tagluense]|uniref:hypothetical protein n=2 Tax=Clostridium TaxID=1485 RepID=UPI0013E9277D|nr:hypothetical protein [Clostridium tagluense]MBW9156231.1 hypothetical protein [Clostridium tagluense]WLC65532.1 hypothetical protein KTC93_22535 [Clostridium tagluense]